jgi:hypothetical protein
MLSLKLEVLLEFEVELRPASKNGVFWMKKCSYGMKLSLKLEVLLEFEVELRRASKNGGILDEKMLIWDEIVIET